MKTLTFFSTFIASAVLTFASSAEHLHNNLLPSVDRSAVGQPKEIEIVKMLSGIDERAIKVTKINDTPYRLRLTVPNTGANKVSVTIFDAEGELVVQEKHDVKGDLILEYNFTKVSSYTFVISDKGGNSTMIQY